MTLVLASVFKEGTLVLSDSRASSENGQISEDILQKIVGINKDLIIGYSGDVAAVNRVLLSVQQAANEGTDSPEELLHRITKICVDELKQNGDRFALLVFQHIGDIWKVNRFNPDDFKPEAIDDIALIGSGSTIGPNIVPFYESIVDDNEDLKNKADRIIWNVSSLLSSTGAEGVGGMIQALLLLPNGVRTIHTGFVDMNPDGEPESKQIIYENGQWTQHNFASNTKEVIISPDKLLQQPVHETVFHNYERATGNKQSKWYLNSFLASMGIVTDHYETTFIGQLTAMGVAHLPKTINFMIYISLFGPSTEHKMEIVHLDADSSRSTIYSGSFDNVEFPIEYEFIQELQLKARAAGNHYLECVIDGEVAGRKLIYIHEVDETLPPQVNGANLQNGHKSTDDELLKDSELVWFFVGNERGELKPESHSIKGQFKVAYSTSFPINLIGYANFGVRSKPGEHSFEIRMFDAASHETVSTAASTLECSSTSITKPCEVKFDLTFPKPGFYFVSLKIDGVMKGVTVVMADGSPPNLTYTLPVEELENLKRDGLMLLAKRSVQKKDEAS